MNLRLPRVERSRARALRDHHLGAVGRDPHDVFAFFLFFPACERARPRAAPPDRRARWRSWRRASPSSRALLLLLRALLLLRLLLRALRNRFRLPQRPPAPPYLASLHPPHASALSLSFFFVFDALFALGALLVRRSSALGRMPCSLVHLLREASDAVQHVVVHSPFTWNTTSCRRVKPLASVGALSQHPPELVGSMTGLWMSAGGISLAATEALKTSSTNRPTWSTPTLLTLPKSFAPGVGQKTRAVARTRTSTCQWCAPRENRLERRWRRPHTA